MAHTVPFPRGGTFHGTSGTIDTSDLAGQRMEGLPFKLPALDSSGDPIKGEYVEGLVVRNISGSTLASGEAVSWKTAYRNRQVDSNPALYGETAGIVDDQLGSTTVRNGDLFLLIRKGKCRHRTHTTSATISVGDTLYASANAGTLVSFDGGSSSGNDYDMDDHLDLSRNAVGIATQACATTANDSSLRGIDVTID